MARTLTIGRTFERSTRRPLHLKEPVSSEEPAWESRKYYYRRLMQVSVFNSYYNTSGERCADFQVQPTPTSRNLMASLGLLFKDEGTGFSVLYDTKDTDVNPDTGRRENRLVSYLRLVMERSTMSPPADSSPRPPLPQVWTRLSFVLSLNNPYFINQTDVPIDLNPAEKNLYYTNQRVRDSSPPGEPVLEPEILPTASTQVSVRMEEDDFGVDLLAISGETVTCIPRCVPVDLVKKTGNPAAITCKEVKDYSPPEKEVCRTDAYLDLSRFPEDPYTVRMVPSTSLPPPREHRILYTTSDPLPLCFVNLLLTRPTEDYPEGVYPVKNLYDEGSPPRAAKIVPVHYQLRFKERSTLWCYYIVPQPQSRKLEGLQINQYVPNSRASSPPEGIEFYGPCCVKLANGQRAYRFVSVEPIPLRQRSPYHFRLFDHQGVLVKRLPVAGPQQVLPESELESCIRLVDSLCCLEEVNYSAIYVYV